MKQTDVPEQQPQNPDESAAPGKSKVIHRAMVVRRLLSLYEEPRYLEVGVNKGHTFDRQSAARKVAVDPVFLFDHEAAEKADPTAEYHQVTSDEYFASIVAPDELFDVIYLDGLHTFEQTLRDLTNALHHLQPKGLIVIDDVRPPTYLASIPDRQNFFTVRSWLGSTDQAWMGDVYKLVWFIDTFYPHLSFRTIDNNHGQLVVWRERRAEVTERSVEEIAQLSFETFALEQDVLRATHFRKIMDEVRAWRER
ncbi:class I SAM-dependent methyltransferase [Nocardioides pacificus]